MLLSSSVLMLGWVAADIRRRAGLDRPPYSTTAIARICCPDVLITGGRLPKGIHEVVTRRDDFVAIVYERSLSGPEQRIAIAHALCHVLFDGRDECARRGSLGVASAEHRADWFAAELLAPRTEVAELAARWPSLDEEEHEIYLDHVDELASRFAVPAPIIDLRIRELVPVYKTG